MIVNSILLIIVLLLCSFVECFARDDDYSFPCQYSVVVYLPPGSGRFTDKDKVFKPITNFCGLGITKSNKNISII